MRPVASDRLPARVPELDPDQCIWCASVSLLVAAQRAPEGASKMLDIVVLAIGLGFFALSVGYAIACDQL